MGFLEFARESDISIDEVFVSFLLDKIANNSRSTDQCSTFDAYEKLLKSFSIQQSFADQTQLISNVLFDTIKSIDSHTDNANLNVSIKELLFLFLEKFDLFASSDQSFLLFVDLMQLILSTSVYKSPKSLYFNFESIQSKLSSYLQANLFRSLEKVCESSANESDLDELEEKEIQDPDQSQVVNKDERSQLEMRLNSVLSKLIDFIGFVADLSSSTNESAISIEPESSNDSFDLRPFLNTFLVNLFYEPLVVSFNGCFSINSNLLERIHFQIIKLNGTENLVKLIQLQFREQQSDACDDKKWHLEHQIQPLAAALFAFSLIDPNKKRFSFPSVYTFNYLFINVHLPVMKQILSIQSNHLINAKLINKCLTIHTKQLESHFIDRVDSLKINNEIDLNQLIKLFEILFKNAVFSAKKSIRTNVYFFVNKLFNCLEVDLKETLISFFLFKTCQSNNGSENNKKYLSLKGDRTKTEPSSDDLYLNDSFNAYLASFFIYLFKEIANNELKSSINSNDPKIFFVDAQDPSGVKLSESFKKIFLMIFNINYLNVDSDLFVNDYLLKSDLLVKEESKFIAQMNLLRFLLLITGNNTSHQLKDQIKNLIGRTHFMQLMDKAIEKVCINYELEKRSIQSESNNETVLKPNESSIEFNVNLLNEKSQQNANSSQKQSKLEAVNKSIRTVELLKSLHTRINELLD